MAKYSTGGSSGSGDGDACELCGAETNALREANVAGAELLVCRDCAPHDDAAKKPSSGSEGGGQGGSGDSDADRKRQAAQNAAKANPIWDGDSSHWEEEGTDYDDDPLPYLVTGYGDALTEARQDAGLQREELAEEMGIEESVLLAIEQGRATQAGVPGSIVEALEERLDVELIE